MISSRGMTCIEDGTDLLIEQLKNDPEILLVNLVINPTHEFPSTYRSIVSRIFVNFFPTITYVRNLETLANLDQTGICERQYCELKQYTNIGIINQQNRSQLMKELSKMLQTFELLNPSQRQKYLIILMNGDDSIIEPFLSFAWTKKFLDLTVLDWVQREEILSNRKVMYVTEKPSYDISICTFNPFYGTYNRNILSSKTSLFPDKLKDLNGYEVHAKLRESFETKFYDVLGSFTGLFRMDPLIDVFLTNTVAESMNFSSILNFTLGTGALGKIFNETLLLPRANEKWGSFDICFSLEPLQEIEEDCYNTEPCFEINKIVVDKYPLISIDLNVIVEQHIPLKKEFSQKLFAILGIFFAIVLTFHVVSRLFGFDVRKYPLLYKILRGRSDSKFELKKIGSKNLIVSNNRVFNSTMLKSIVDDIESNNMVSSEVKSRGIDKREQRCQDVPSENYSVQEKLQVLLRHSTRQTQNHGTENFGRGESVSSYVQHSFLKNFLSDGRRSSRRSLNSRKNESVDFGPVIHCSADKLTSPTGQVVEDTLGEVIEHSSRQKIS
ncbi:hypothetical protein QAD02_001358 [Eretmocerus hayati]|uniref:Uncharacterized protein n=1 Tax=Eretmocerus hayati TaxID=131215 RepID=A0ACC2NIE4_9HYME|nr:hypothetical protein QAD02_001358 [Eretmocerus hayati]